MLLTAEDKAWISALAHKLTRLFPPAMEKAFHQRKVAVRLNNILSALHQDISAFQASRRLGWISQALLSYTLRCQLEAFGYSHRLSGHLSKTVAKHLALAR